MIYKYTHFASLPHTHKPQLCLYSSYWPRALVCGAQTETVRILRPPVLRPSRGACHHHQPGNTLEAAP